MVMGPLCAPPNFADGGLLRTNVPAELLERLGDLRHERVEDLRGLRGLERLEGLRGLRGLRT